MNHSRAPLPWPAEHRRDESPFFARRLPMQQLQPDPPWLQTSAEPHPNKPVERAQLQTAKRAARKRREAKIGKRASLPCPDTGLRKVAALKPRRAARRSAGQAPLAGPETDCFSSCAPPLHCSETQFAPCLCEGVALPSLSGLSLCIQIRPGAALVRLQNGGCWLWSSTSDHDSRLFELNGRACYARGGDG